MIRLTPTQLSDIQSLVENPAVDQTGVDFQGNGLMKVTIISKLDADREDIDKVLQQIFPGMEYRGTVGVEVSNGELYEFYFIDWNGETLINLLMKKAPVGAEAEKKYPNLIVP
ncbi:hypothetical protein [Desulfosporosinus youngiae]|uniref:Uncharacterized protein n=1 Tax=Desulfosporosinus youngiae DSM 17734 TaxID=768710 RepID=H5XZX8_9FIRM|nr:hypothetical protein [Desulfosporosinus youngiae]EHQ92174.1 hypothetical protein DesyoDRAFT_5244 [Desulfosporosinus youngiae DSM 17734]